MKFLSSTFLALLSTTSITIAAPAPLEARTSALQLFPSSTSLYNVWTGAVTHGVSRGKVFKNGREPDITTLVAFDIPAAAAGKHCQFMFNLAGNAVLSGSEKFDVFSSLAPAGETSTTWPNGNLRDRQLGRMQAVKNGVASWVWGSGRFDCPAGQLYGMELVGVYDVDDIQWDVGAAGPTLLITSD